MGSDKAVVEFHGQPLIKHVINRVAHLADEILVTTNTPRSYEFLGLPLIKDRIPGRGALGGLYTALSAANHGIVAVFACDMPFLNPELLKYELDQIDNQGVDIVIPRTDTGNEPFHAVYRREACLNPVESALQAGNWRVDSWFSEVKLLTIPPNKLREYDPHLMSFFNINTPGDLAHAREIYSISGAENPILRDGDE